MNAALLEQETHRQAILQAMGLEVWLPRQQLPHAAPTPDWLLDWDSAASSMAVATASTPSPAPVSSAPVAPSQSAPAATSNSGKTQAQIQMEQVRQVLQQAQSAARTAAPPQPVAVDTPVVVEQPAPATVPFPRFSLQLLRSGNCLLLVDLPMGEPFQARDPEYLLLKDILRAAGLNDAPSMLRNGEAIRWPILSKGNLAQEQGAEQARTFVRELLLHESSQQQCVMLWLMGGNAVTYANREDDEAEEFSLTPLQEQVQCWNLPSLESIMRQPQLKPQLWRSMQKLMSRWL